MAEIDVRRIAELAKEPPHVLRGRGAGAVGEARKALECQALMVRRKQDADAQEADPS